jgi:hypothetical protein
LWSWNGLPPKRRQKKSQKKIRGAEGTWAAAPVQDSTLQRHAPVTNQEITMHASTAVGLLAAFACAPAFAASMNGKLPMYPNGHNLNAMPASAVAMGVPMVLETTDPAAKVDAWYGVNAPKSCARTAASGGVKYACPGGAIMIYPHGGKTQIAFVPAMPAFPGGR